MNLVNHFLIATPNIQSDPYFSNSLVYIVQQYEKGTVGLVINKQLNLDTQSLLEKASIASHAAPIYSHNLAAPAMATGPVNPSSIVTLHQGQVNDYYWSAAVTDQVAITFSSDILASLGTWQEPEHFLVGCGYAFWGPEQLEQEIRYNAWLNVPAKKEIIFETPIDARRNAALDLLGMQPEQLSYLNGHG